MMVNSIESTIELLRQAYGRPSRRLRKDVESIAQRSGGPADAWLALQDARHISSEFIGNPNRLFGPCVDVVVLDPSQGHVQDEIPSSLDLVLAIAADPQGMMIAEERANELARRLEPWTAAFNGKTVWYCAHRHIDWMPYLGLAYDSARDTVTHSLQTYGIDAESLVPSTDLPLIVRFALVAWAGWNLASNNDWEIREPKWPLNLNVWQRFRQLPNPFEPILDLWMTGYLLFCPFSPADPYARLYAPRIGLAEVARVAPH